MDQHNMEYTIRQKKSIQKFILLVIILIVSICVAGTIYNNQDKPKQIKIERQK